MNRKSWKLVLAGVFVACAFGGLAVGLAWATPGFGVINTIISGPLVHDELDMKAASDTHEIELRTRGRWVSRVIHHRIVPGGYTGWHSHPGPVFVMINAGTFTKYEAGDPNPHVYPPGSGFVEAPGSVHLGRNEGNVDVQLVAYYLTPEGASPRTDEPQP